MSQPSRPFYNDRVFWDVNVDTLDFDVHAAMIIERIFDRGDVEDIRLCRRYYGDAKIEEIILAAPYLSWGRLHLASAIINQPIQSFRCYTSKRLNPTLAPY
jgi:hypothetical protein